MGCRCLKCGRATWVSDLCPPCAVREERLAAVRFLRHWASPPGVFEDVDGWSLLNEFANRLEDGEHLWPPGECRARDPSKDDPLRPLGKDPTE